MSKGACKTLNTIRKWRREGRTGPEGNDFWFKLLIFAEKRKAKTKVESVEERC
jgi:hypothetical protein